MQKTELYQELIIDHGTNPRNFSKLPDHTHTAEGYNPLCGDQVTLFLLIHKQVIVKASFQGQGCAIATASASIMTELISHKTIIQGSALFDQFIGILTNDPQLSSEDLIRAEQLLPNKLLAIMGVKAYPARIKCATLAWHALRSILEQVKVDHYKK